MLKSTLWSMWRTSGRRDGSVAAIKYTLGSRQSPRHAGDDVPCWVGEEVDGEELGEADRGGDGAAVYRRAG